MGIAGVQTWKLSTGMVGSLKIATEGVQSHEFSEGMVGSLRMATAGL